MTGISFQFQVAGLQGFAKPSVWKVGKNLFLNKYRVSRKTLSTFVSAISRFRKHRQKKFWTFSNSPIRWLFEIVQDHFIWVIFDWDIHEILRKTQNEKSHFDGKQLSAIKVNFRMLWGIFSLKKKSHTGSCSRCSPPWVRSWRWGISERVYDNKMIPNHTKPEWWWNCWME